MKINSLSKKDALRQLVSSEEGLSEAEAAKRLVENGHNEIRETHKTHLTLRFFSQFTHFLAILLWIGAGLSFLSDYLHPGEGMAMLGFAIVGVILINAVFTFIQEYRAEKALEALKKLLPFQVRIMREGTERQIHSREIVPGDILFFSEGDRIPADARLIESSMLKVNNAALTGESEASLRDHNPFQGELLESPNIVFAGTTVTSGSGKGLVFATGMSTEFGRIAHLTSAVESGLSPLQKEIIKVTRFIAVMATVMGGALFLIGHAMGRSFWENFIFTIGLIVANVPEGLLPTVTLALVMGSKRLAKKNALIKTLTSVETLGSVTVICTDKTGTLTQNKMAATKIWSENRIVEAKNYTPQTQDMLMYASLLCNNARFVDEMYRGDPTETALLRLARERIGNVDAQRIFEIPFDSDRKRMTTLNRIEEKEYVFTKGAMESILPLCSGYRMDSNEKPMDHIFHEKVMDAYHQLMDSGLRVLAFAYKEYEGQGARGKGQNIAASRITDNASLETDLVFAGLIGLEDPPRPEVPDALIKCHGAGIRVIMITGDASRTAVAIGREIGLVRGEPLVIEGADFTKLDDRELREKLSAKEIIFARMTPKHKMRVVSILKEQGERVAVTGDGVNDAPALKKADIGIAMGISGTDVAKEAADLILLDDNFATIVSAVEEGRTVFENIRKFITYIFAHGTPEAVPYILFALFRIPLPLTVMQILAIDLGTETIPALALGIEPPESNVMKHPPRPQGNSLIDLNVLLRGYLFLGLISSIGVLFVYFMVLLQGGWHWGMELPFDSTLTRQASTATFLGIVIMQIGTVFACRTQSESVFKRGVFSNRMILWGIAAEILLSAFIIYHPWGNRIFATEPLGADIWLILIPFMLLVFFADEARKGIGHLLRSSKSTFSL
jgi:sodium/potassium-transporting ATPase subunit alpha